MSQRRPWGAAKLFRKMLSLSDMTEDVLHGHMVGREADICDRHRTKTGTVYNFDSVPLFCVSVDSWGAASFQDLCANNLEVMVAFVSWPKTITTHRCLSGSLPF